MGRVGPVLLRLTLPSVLQSSHLAARFPNMLKSVVSASHVGGDGRAGSSPAVISPDRRHIVCLRRICCAGSPYQPFPFEVPRQEVLGQLGSAPARHARRHGSERRAARIMAAYNCKSCEIEGQDLEASPGRVICWNCEREATVTARIVVDGA